VIGRADIEGLVPHAGAMCLWEAVAGWDRSRIVLHAHGHRDPAHPLRRDGRLHAVHLCEYGAQAMAVHGGLVARAAGQPPRAGMLVALRGVALHVARFDDLAGVLVGEAEQLADSPASQQYAFRLHCDGVLLAEGRAAVMLAPTMPA